MTRTSIVAPFITDYVLKKSGTVRCKLLKCRSCGFIFFDKRFTDSEVKKLYGQYRKQAYVRTRNKHEFYYSPQVNAAFDEDVEYRRHLIADFLANLNIDERSYKNVLDYGGDRGQFFPSCFDRSHKWLYDLSDHKPFGTVTKFSKFTADKKNFFDYVQMCHVLEHMSYPHTFIASIRGFMRPRGYLYIEVPSDHFNFRSADGNFSDAYISYITANRRMYKFIDVMSMFFRMRLGVLPFWGIMKLHEHLNFFSTNTLRCLLENNGFHVLKIEEKNKSKQTKGGYVRTIIQCVATRSSIGADGAT